jgi:hypothetical protein
VQLPRAGAVSFGRGGKMRHVQTDRSGVMGEFLEKPLVGFPLQDVRMKEAAN